MQVFDTRAEMLSIVPKNGVVCEVGVFRGDFAASILAVCEPREMVLIDEWPDRTISTGDVDGLNRVWGNGYDLRRQVQERFTGKPVRTVRGLSQLALAGFDDDSFDMIYIDADHSREAVTTDLDLALQKVRLGGYIMGHDYLPNYTKNPIVWDRFGVKEAVDEFCGRTGQEICAMALDGCTSFAIQVEQVGVQSPAQSIVSPAGSVA